MVVVGAATAMAAREMRRERWFLPVGQNLDIGDLELKASKNERISAGRRQGLIEVSDL